MTKENAIDVFGTNLPAPPSTGELDTEIQENFQAHLILLHDISNPVKEGKGKAGHYFVSDMDLGPEVTFVGLFYRLHAKLTIGGVKSKESFDKDSPVFKEIKAIKTDMKKNTMSKWGVSILGFLPSHGMFFIYHPNSPSSRGVGKQIAKLITPLDQRSNEADRMLPFTRIIKLTSQLIDKNVAVPFWKPVVSPMPMDYLSEHNITSPPKDKIEEQVNLFLAPTLIKEKKEEEGSER
jgi:hypothetical protein